ncbi:hypothetical protein ATERTT37_006848 [Aspergillus terreus]
MPAVGDQHRGGAACITMPNTNGTMAENPFEEPQRRMSEYTAQQIATLQARLDKKLGPEYISSRPGAAGQRVHYLAADKCINLANEVFGFNGWSSSIVNIQIDFVDENPNTGKISLGLSVIVRVTLKDGTYHEDIGYGHIENCKGKAAAFEKAKKEGTTDALKRSLRNFGNVLGNCIYDKEYVSKVTKVKAVPAKWDINELHRHPDFAPKKEPAPPKRVQEDDDLPPQPAVTAAKRNPSDSSNFDGDGEFGTGTGTGAAQVPVKREPGPPPTDSRATQDMLPPGSTPSASFFSARAVDLLRDNPQAGAAPPFDPHAESPSIRKTAGVDHTKSVPISKPMLAGVSPASNNTRDFVNPSSDVHRKIGVPGGGGMNSPLNRNQSTSSYRPLTRPNVDPRNPASAMTANRPPQNINGKRPPLNDVTNASNPGGSGPAAPGAGVDPKRPRINEGVAAPQQQQPQQ